MTMSKRYYFILIICFVMGLPSAWCAPLFKTLNDDGKQWFFDSLARNIYAIGDTHADPTALLTIVKNLGLMNTTNEWVAKNVDVVIMGDMVGAGVYSQLNMRLIKALKIAAERNGSRIHLLMGNNEVYVLEGDASRVPAADNWEVIGTPVSGKKAKFKPITREFRDGAEFSEQFQDIPGIIQIDGFLFVHAGVDEWLLKMTPGEINATLRAWVLYYQGKGLKPPANTEWVIGLAGTSKKRNKGPLFSRRLVKEKIAAGVVDQIMTAYRLKKILVGHTPTVSHQIEYRYGGKVVLTDSGISRSKHGELSAFRMVDNLYQAFSFDRPLTDMSIDSVQRVIEQLVTQKPGDSKWRNFCPDLRKLFTRSQLP